MAKENEQRWRPDTCLCVLRYKWRDEAKPNSPGGPKIVTYDHVSEFKCALHADEDDGKQHYDAVLKLNQEVNHKRNEDEQVV